MSDVKMMPVNSSNVHLVGYDPEAQEMHVTFKDGPMVYIHSGVDSGTFSSFMNAKSKGLFYSKQFKGNSKFPFKKTRPTPPQL